MKIIRASIAHFKYEDDEHLEQSSILNREQMDWLKMIEYASDKVISPLEDSKSKCKTLRWALVILLSPSGEGMPKRRGGLNRPQERTAAEHTGNTK